MGTKGHSADQDRWQACDDDAAMRGHIADARGWHVVHQNRHARHDDDIGGPDAHQLVTHTRLGKATGQNGR